MTIPPSAPPCTPPSGHLQRPRPGRTFGCFCRVDESFYVYTAYSFHIRRQARGNIEPSMGNRYAGSLLGREQRGQRQDPAFHDSS